MKKQKYNFLENINNGVEAKLKKKGKEKKDNVLTMAAIDKASIE